MNAISSSIQHSRHLISYTLVVLVLRLIVLPGSALAESGTRQQPSQIKPAAGASPRIFAEPLFIGTNRYLPGSHTSIKLPVAANGYSVISLRDQHKWQTGQDLYQAIFDGQLYWFSNPREKGIFIAAPEKYAPVLGGDCIVSFSETSKRVPGDPRYGVVHRGRTYFFANERFREQFQDSPERYARADIAHRGNCIVSKIDQQKEIQGLPATIAVVGGLRYYFAGSHQRAIFGSRLDRYGVNRSILANQFDTTVASKEATSRFLPSEDSSGQQALANAKLLADDESNSKTAEKNPGNEETIPDDKLAMEGYCPVSIREQGIWVEGNVDFSVEKGGKFYLLAGESQKKKFLENPKLYLPVLEGDCVVTLVKKNQRTSGSVFYSKRSKDNKHIFLFAGAEEKRSFEANPTIYLEAIQAEATPAQ